MIWLVGPPGLEPGTRPIWAVGSDRQIPENPHSVHPQRPSKISGAWAGQLLKGIKAGAQCFNGSLTNLSASLGFGSMPARAPPGIQPSSSRPARPLVSETHILRRRVSWRPIVRAVLAAIADSWTFRETSRPIAVTICPRFAVNTANGAIDAALAGAGIARVLSY